MFQLHDIKAKIFQLISSVIPGLYSLCSTSNIQEYIRMFILSDTTGTIFCLQKICLHSSFEELQAN